MAAPLLIVAGMGISALFGAFAGAQVDDKIEGTPISSMDKINQIPSFTKIAYYSAIGMGLFWLASRSGAIKIFK